MAQTLFPIGGALALLFSLSGSGELSAQNRSGAPQERGEVPSNSGREAGDLAPNSTPLAAKLEQFLHRKPYFPDGFTGSVLVARDGRVILHRSYGLARAQPARPLHRNAIWDWCSVSKQFTAAAILRLQMQDKLELDDPITRHFERAPKDKKAVTIRHLLTHTSGLENDRGYGKAGLFDRKKSMRYLLRRPLATAPGEAFEYSNAGYFLLGGLIEEVSGRSYEDFLRTEVLEPAAMKTAGCIGDDHIDYHLVPFQDEGRGDRQFAYGKRLSWGYRGAGGVLASTEDMFAWDRALRSDAVLDQAARTAMFTATAHGYGLGWRITRAPGGARIAYHSGNTGSIVTFFLRYLDADVVVALAFSKPPGRRGQMAAMSLGGLTAAAKSNALIAGEPIEPPASAASSDPAPPPASTPRDLLQRLTALDEPAEFFAVMAAAEQICRESPRAHVEFMQRFARYDRSTKRPANLAIRFQTFARMLNERVLRTRKQAELKERFAAVRDRERELLGTLKSRSTATKRAIRQLETATKALDQSIRAALPLDTRPAYSPGR